MEIPVDWKGLQKETQDALRVLDMVGKTPVPQTLRDAIDENYFAASQGIVETALGSTSGAELREWSQRVIRLSDANEILRNFENNLVREFVLSSASPARIVIDAMIAIPKWILAHLAEIVFILWPLFTGAVKGVLDVQDIEERIKRIDEELAEYRETLAELFGLSPGDKIQYSPTGSPAGDAFQRSQPQRWTAADLVASIKEVERRQGILKREKAALIKLSERSSNILDMIAVAVAATLAFFMVERLLAAAASLAASTKTFGPVRKLRDEAVMLAKEKSLPQWGQKRVTVRKRSRRN
jgi:hypothetical protein